MAVLEEGWEIIREATQRLREERARRPLLRWEEVEFLEQKGLLPEEIGELLGMKPRVVHTHREVARTHAHRVRLANDTRRPWEKLGDRHAFFYPDADRQNWVLWQMGLAERKR